MYQKLSAMFFALVLATTAALFTAQQASAVTANVTISASTASNGTTTLTYGATATAAGTVRYVDVTIPPGTGGQVTSVNGIVRTVATGTLRWYPSRTVTVYVGSRFSIPFYGLILPTGGPWTLSFKAVSTTGSTITYGTGVLGGANIRISATNPIPGQKTDMTYSGTITTRGVLTKVVMEAPPGATGVLSTVNGTLTSRNGYITWWAKSPITVSPGARVSIPLYGMRLSVYGGVLSLSMSAQTSGGSLLMSGKGTISLIAPPATMPAVTVAGFAPIPSGCPTKWDDTVTENAKPGSGNWVIPTTSTTIEAYATRVSATCGQTVGLKVDYGKPVNIIAYRMGYYGGLGAREVWRAVNVPTVAQPAPTIGGTDSAGHALRMVSAKNWSTTLTVPIDDKWVPGTYLFKITDGTYSTYAPLTVRDDTGTKHDILIQQATTTWAAYNAWGGYSFYSPSGSGAGSSRLSFDRPYAGGGAGQYLPLEQGLVFWAESKGLDVTYWTDNDLDQFGGQLPLRAANIFLPSHDEYYTLPMRASLSQAISKGVNVASLGANTVYRRMWFTNDTRREWDIDNFTAGYNSTIWRYLGDAYASQPLLGAEYSCPLPGNTLTTGTSWLFEGITPGTTIPGFIAGEIDLVDKNLYRQPGLTVVGSGTGLCRSGSESSPMHITTFTAPSGARVFNGSTFAYSCFLNATCSTTWSNPRPTATQQKLVGIMVANITKWVSKGTVTLAQAEKTTLEPMKVKAPQRQLPMYEEAPPGQAKK